MDVDDFQPVRPGSFIDRTQEDAADARLRRSSRCSDHFTELSRQPRIAKSSRRLLYQEPREFFEMRTTGSFIVERGLSLQFAHAAHRLKRTV